MNSKGWFRFQRSVILLLASAMIVAMVFYGYRPTSYDLEVGSVSNRDIYAQRTFVDSYQTEFQAINAKNNAGSVFIRSEELSVENQTRVLAFFDVADKARRNILTDLGTIKKDLTAEADAFDEMLSEDMDLSVDRTTLLTILGMPGSNYSFFMEKCISASEIIMMNNLDASALISSINEQVNIFEQNNQSLDVAYSDAMRVVLRTLLSPNSIIDENATKDAGENAYTAAINDPVIIEKGTKIVGVGEIVTDHIYRNLKDLELIRSDSFDFIIFGRVALYVLLIITVTCWYMSNSRTNITSDIKAIYTIVITSMIPIAASLYLSNISSSIAIILFFTTIISSYIGLSAGIILSLSEALIMWPVMNFDIQFLIISIVGMTVCANFAGNKKRHYNSAWLIVVPTIFSVAASAFYNFILGTTNLGFIDSLVWTSITAILSIVIAIGLMPIYELFSNAVTPVKLIELSQPGHPLIKRLFLEAPGTYQHSMMVANLSDAAAEAIGADALLCKVASYYHDIGKLENPMYFTENQADGYNPHDDLSIEESVAILTAHPEDGVKIGKKNKLPDAILKVIDEHHGTTYPGYFYMKACKIAEERGLPRPDVNLFRYRGHIPSSKESAIVMIADTCEAAIRSNKLTDLDEIEKKIRELIKGKIDQDQLIESCLSFHDIELMIASFKQIYSGVVHERIKY